MDFLQPVRSRESFPRCQVSTTSIVAGWPDSTSHAIWPMRCVADFGCLLASSFIEPRTVWYVSL